MACLRIRLHIAAMVAFGPKPTVAAHASAGNPLAPRRDRAVDACRLPAPTVPRAPKAKSRSQSAGALARSMWSRRPGGDCILRPDSESDVLMTDIPSGSSGDHRRKALLQKEVTAVENQRFEMGPARPGPEAVRTDYARGHVLSVACNANRGMPWMPGTSEALDAGYPAVGAGRRHTLLHERKAADQALEWAPAVAFGAAVAEDKDYSRVNILRREDQEPFEFLPGAGRNSRAHKEGDCYARKNIMIREHASGSPLDAPRAVQMDCGGAPNFSRDNRLARMNPAGFALRGAGAAMMAS